MQMGMLKKAKGFFTSPIVFYYRYKFRRVLFFLLSVISVGSVLAVEMSP